MENNAMVLIFCWFASFVGLVQWGVLTLLLMEVVLCKDATTANTSRILNKRLGARLRLFKRSLQSTFYKASVGLFAGSLLSMCYMMEKLWTKNNIEDFYPFTLFSLFVPICIYYIYRHIGFTSTFFDRFGEFIRREDN